jgi:3-hydroxymyristoyl/3-hydroxydecanoyl-(acyl carrier protein) dehydratase
MTGISRDEIEAFWKEIEDGGQRSEIRGQKSEIRDQRTEDRGLTTEGGRQRPEIRDQRSEERGQRTEKPALFGRDKLLAFALGKPSEAFGNLYKEFDEDRFIARLPSPPYLFMDRITHIEPEQWVLKQGGWIEAEYDVTSDAWYFSSNRTPLMPFCVLLEIALQPCGWLAAYMGSALKSKKDLRFRNLGGNATLFHEVLPEAKTLTMRTRLTQVSEAADMIIEQFDIQVLQADQMIYKGDLTFGFFSKESLTQQVGIHDAKQNIYNPSSDELKIAKSFQLKDTPPFSPDTADPQYMDSTPSLAMPAKALRMIDIIDIYIPDGGPFGLGFIRGTKKVDPSEWFFKAHFYQDPVCPGSLGIESFLQLIKFIAFNRWGHLADSYRFGLIIGKPHSWTYRGQITPENTKIEVEAVVTTLHDMPVPYIMANGYLKVDGLYIYKMENFGIKLVPM